VIPGVDGKDAHYGSLTTGYGCGDGNGGVQSNLIGPEYGFGFGLQDPASALKGDKVLIIKTAWGGKTIAVDFRPPSSSNGSMWSPPMLPNGGHYYNTMLQDVEKIMAPGTIGKMYPDLAGMTPVISGFGWHQGWNDGCNLNQTAEYETNLVNLIKDLRKEWKSPQLPVSIAVSGFDGFDNEEASRHPKGCWDSDSTKTECDCTNDRGCRRLDVVLSQFGPGVATRHPELGGHVSAMETRGYLRDAEFSPNKGQGYHWYHNAETAYLLGKAMASGMLVASGHEPIPGFTPGQTQLGRRSPDQKTTAVPCPWPCRGSRMNTTLPFRKTTMPDRPWSVTLRPPDVA
jgi:alpha-galactosidase